MFTIDIAKWIPAFIMRDKNGKALAKAIEAGLQAMNDVIAQGVACVNNVDTMPEWRLDELAWEFNIPFDFTADIAVKRKWIAEAVTTYSTYGTPAVIKNYLESMFDSARVEEWWEYGGDPHHFKVYVTGEPTASNMAWATEVIEKTKNCRSYLDELVFDATESEAELLVDSAITGIEITGTIRTI